MAVAKPVARTAPRDQPTAVRPQELRGSLLTDYLTELRERMGADELVLWRTRPDGRLIPAEWSSNVSGGMTASELGTGNQDKAPPCFNFDAWMQRVEWAASQHTLQFERRGPGVSRWYQVRYQRARTTEVPRASRSAALYGARR